MEVRLNSPCGKFKMTNMADDQVDLTAEDIAGASFIEEEIEKLTVSQLKFWSKCLRLNQNGNGKELLESYGVHHPARDRPAVSAVYFHLNVYIAVYTRVYKICFLRVIDLKAMKNLK